MEKEYKDYVEEIDYLKRTYNLTLDKVLLLQISAAFMVDKLDYNKLKEKFVREALSK